MDRKQILRDILALCKQGKFKEALRMLHNVEINNKWIINFIVGCCSTCVAYNATPEVISEDDLYNFLMYIIPYLRDINEADLLSYLQSLFHILKFFIRKESYNLIAKMETILVPVFLPSLLTLPKKLKDTLQSSASLLYNSIAKTSLEEFKPLVVICNIISKIYAAVSNASGLLSMSYNCAIRLSHLSCPIKEQEDYFFNVLNLAKSDTMNEYFEDDFKSFVSHFTLILNNIFKQFDFEGAAEFYEKSFDVGLQIFENDCVNVLTLLKFPLLFSPYGCNDKLESLVKCKRSLSYLRSVAQKQLVASKLNSLIYTLLLYYKSVNELDWCKISEVCRLELLQFIYDISRLELQRYSCSCNCSIEGNVFQAFTYSQYICTLLEICNRRKVASAEFNKVGANFLAQFCEDIKILKDYNCEKWKSAWSTLGTVMYNIGVHLYQDSDESCLHYFYDLIKYFIKFELCNAIPILKLSSISSAFVVICNYSIKDCKKCMALSALAIRLCPDARNVLFTNWIKAKLSQRELKTPESNEAQKLTLVSAFTQLKQEMEFLTNGVDFLSISDRIELLAFELEQYKLKWKSKVPMMSALKELCQIADLDKIVEVTISIFGECDIMLHEDVLKIFEKFLIEYEEKLRTLNDRAPESIARLSFVYHMHYTYCAREIVIKNTDDMERKMSVVAQKSEDPFNANPNDPNEECDIVSSYDCLKLNKYIGIIKHLNKSLDLLASIVTDGYNPNDFSKRTLKRVYNLLLDLSFQYKLHSYKVKNLQALQLALKVAQCENNPCDIVSAIGFIIENSDVKKNYVDYLMMLADKELPNIELSNVRNLKVVLTYYICLTKSLLYKDYKEAYNVFQKANDLYDSQEDKSELQLIKSQLHLLHFKFVLLPCKFGIVDHKESTLLTLHLANATVYEVYKKTRLDRPYEMSVLLEANEELAKLHHYLHCPREVRSYCRETIILAQQLVLPIRCAYYLVYLAHADLRSSRYDDCRVKIEGLADILCLTKHNVHVDQENKPPQNVEIEKELAGITNDMQEMVLDLPESNNYRKQFSPSSPTLLIQPFRLPSFVTHESSCDCFCCLSLEYQSLVLEKIRLDALLHVKQKNVAVAYDFFEGALNLYELCRKKSKTCIENGVKFIYRELIPEFFEELLEAYGFTLLDYSYHLMRNGNKSEASRITDKLISLVSPKKLQYVYLYNEALFQKLSYLTETPSILEVDKVEMENLCPEVNVISTTPETKHSKVTFTMQRSPSFTLPKRRVKKCIPFNLSPSQDTSNNNEVEKTSPVSKQPKTPAPKIKIYSDDSTVEKAKNPTSTIQIFADTAKKTRKKTVTDDSFPKGVVNTPVLPRSVNSETVLKSKTKLLTEKLKKSTKKLETVTGDGEVANGKKKLSSRKNLFDQVESVEGNVAQGGAVRRSARNRKV